MCRAYKVTVIFDYASFSLRLGINMNGLVENRKFIKELEPKMCYKEAVIIHSNQLKGGLES